MESRAKHTLIVKGHFHAAHTLDWHEECSALHGHTYHVELEVVRRGDEPNEDGIIIDLKVMQRILQDVLPDHKCLSVLSCPECGFVYEHGWIDNPTVERIAAEILRRTNDALRRAGHTSVRVEIVRVMETPTGGAVAW